MTRPLNRILLVEDDPDIRAIANLSLTAVGGFTVGLCASGEEALDQAEAFAPDLILLDVMMPGLDGPTTLQALRRKPALDQVPIVFMTAKIQTREVDEYRTLGAAAVVPKPFDPMELPGQLRTLWEELHE